MEKYCKCGTKISRYSNGCRSCANKSRLVTELTRQKMSNSKIGDKNPVWKGDNVGNDSLHEWVNKHKIKPEFCEICKKKPPLDLANISGLYMRELSDWEYLCRLCHMTKDGRREKLIERNKAGTKTK